MSTLDQCKQISTFNNCRDETISRKVIGRILEAGRNAPSPKGVQSLKFIVVEDDETLEKIGNVVGDDRVEQAPTSIVVVSDIGRMARRVGSNNAEKACNSESSCSVQNMRLVAEENDLCSLRFSGFNGEVLGQILDCPDNVVPLDVIVLGYSDNPVPMENKFGMNEVCYYEKYGNQVTTLFDGAEWKGINEQKRIFNKKVKGLIDKFNRWLQKHL